jgi:hypothetical protein
MPLDKQKFLKTKFENRTYDYPVPQLKDWFPEGDTPIWTVRGLTGIELGRALENGERKKTADAYKLEAMTCGDPAAAMDVIKELFANRDEIPERISTRIEYLIEGSVDPKCDLELALALMKFNGMLASNIANKILELSGKGQVVKKNLPDSGTTPE